MLSFKQAVKALNSTWDIGEPVECMDYKGNRYEKNYIIGNPTLADCLVIANYMGLRYHKGYFYNKI